LSSEDRKAYDRARKEIGSRLHIVDMHKSSGGVEEIASKLSEYRNRGVQPAGIIIDWFWPMCERSYSSRGGKAGNENDLRVFAQHMIDRLKQIGADNNCWIWINHQTAPAKSGSKRPEWYDAAEFRSFAWYLDGCLTLTDYSEDNLATLRYSKARNAAKGYLLVKLLGEYSRLELTDDYEVDERRGTYVEKNKGNRVESAADADGAAAASAKKEDYGRQDVSV